MYTFRLVISPSSGCMNERQCTYKVTLRCVRASVLTVEKQWMLRNLRMCICGPRYWACNAHDPIILSSVTYPTVSYFSTLPHNRLFFRKKKKLNLKCVFRFSLQHLSEKKNILGRTERDRIKSLRGSSYEVPVILAQFNWNLNFLDGFSKHFPR